MRLSARVFRNFCVYFFLFFYFIISSEARQITGQVLDSETQKPVRGANVIISGSTKGTVTNFLGFFSLDVDDQNKELIISSIGYFTSKTEIPAASNFKILLIKNYLELPEFDLGYYDRTDPSAVDTIRADLSNPTAIEARYPGGWAHFYNDLGEILKTDSFAHVILDSLTHVKFAVNNSGIISDISTDNLSELHEKQVSSAFSKLKKWISANQNNLPVTQYFVLPVKWSKEIFSVVEESAQPKTGMPDFYKFIGEHIKYPAKARRMGIEGRVFVELIIQRDGSLTDLKVLKGIGGGCDEEALRVLALAPKWIPGKQHGLAVKQKMVMPIIFRLSGDYGRSTASSPYETDFYKCISNTIRYPVEARRMGVEGWVYVQIEITPSAGEIKTIKVIQDIGADCGKEVVRVLGEISPQAILNLKPTSNTLILPIAFGLGDSPKNKTPMVALENQQMLKPIEIIAVGIERERRVIGYNPGFSASMIPGISNSKSTPQSFSDIKPKATSIYLSGKQIKVIPPTIQDYKNLKTLNLEFNMIETLPEELSRLTKLEGLFLAGNKLKSLPENFGDLVSVKEIRFARNSFTEFPLSLIKLPNLSGLDLAENQIKQIPSEIGNLKTLQTLYFQKNYLSVIPESFQNLQNLRSLNLEDNQIESIPVEFGGLINLTSLFMANNQLKDLPESFENLKSLLIIGFANNSFTELPSSITKLTKLTALDLAGNKIKSLPDEIGNLTSLQELYLQHNELSTFPESIFKLTKLKKLYLEGNPIDEKTKRLLAQKLPRTEILF
jgi:TonB family protein